MVDERELQTALARSGFAIAFIPKGSWSLSGLARFSGWMGLLTYALVVGPAVTGFGVFGWYGIPLGLVAGFLELAALATWTDPKSGSTWALISAAAAAPSVVTVVNGLWQYLILHSVLILVLILLASVVAWFQRGDWRAFRPYKALRLAPVAIPTLVLVIAAPTLSTEFWAAAASYTSQQVFAISTAFIFVAGLFLSITVFSSVNRPETRRGIVCRVFESSTTDGVMRIMERSLGRTPARGCVRSSAHPPPPWHDLAEISWAKTSRLIYYAIASRLIVVIVCLALIMLMIITTIGGSFNSAGVFRSWGVASSFTEGNSNLLLLGGMPRDVLQGIVLLSAAATSACMILMSIEERFFTSVADVLYVDIVEEALVLGALRVRRVFPLPATIQELELAYEEF